MSGIATRTRFLSALVHAKNPACRLAATRKTCPGFGALDKKAVLIGGGDPHRANLSEGFLIKDNHLVIVPLREALRRAREYSAYKKIEVEVEQKEDAVTAAESGADIIMLDNMTPGQVGETIKLLDQAGLRDRVTLEVSGGIDETTLGAYAASGADVISMGALTHTVKNFSVTLEIFPK
jgi:nicotinate-nucleotide pyrophosphorylase (carboxylating)